MQGRTEETLGIGWVGTKQVPRHASARRLSKDEDPRRLRPDVSTYCKSQYSVTHIATERLDVVLHPLQGQQSISESRIRCVEPSKRSQTVVDCNENRASV